MSDRIEQPVGIVVSGGRTGTNFFAEKLPTLIPGAVGFHEPDTIHKGRLASDTPFVLREFGIYHGIIGKLCNTTGARNLSHKTVTGEDRRSDLIERFKSHRRKFYQRQTAHLVVEANYGFYGALGLLPDVFANYRVVAVMRDPATWIDSFLHHYTTHYSPNDWLNRLGLRITPAEVGDKTAAALWSQLGVTDKLAWYWNLVYGCIEEAANVDPNVRVFRFEDLFLSPEREDCIRESAAFLADAAGLTPVAKLPADLFDQRINASRASAHETVSDEARRAAEAWCSERRERWYPSNTAIIGPTDAA